MREQKFFVYLGREQEQAWMYILPIQEIRMEKHEPGIEKQVEAENERQPWKTPAVEVIGQVSGTELGGGLTADAGYDIS